MQVAIIQPGATPKLYSPVPSTGSASFQDSLQTATVEAADTGATPAQGAVQGRKASLVNTRTPPAQKESQGPRERSGSRTRTAPWDLSSAPLFQALHASTIPAMNGPSLDGNSWSFQPSLPEATTPFVAAVTESMAQPDRQPAVAASTSNVIPTTGENPAHALTAAQDHQNLPALRSELGVGTAPAGPEVSDTIVAFAEATSSSSPHTFAAATSDALDAYPVQATSNDKVNISITPRDTTLPAISAGHEIPLRTGRGLPQDRSASAPADAHRTSTAVSTKEEASLPASFKKVSETGGFNLSPSAIARNQTPVASHSSSSAVTDGIADLDGRLIPAQLLANNAVRQDPHPSQNAPDVQPLQSPQAEQARQIPHQADVAASSQPQMPVVRSPRPADGKSQSQTSPEASSGAVSATLRGSARVPSLLVSRRALSGQEARSAVWTGDTPTVAFSAQQRSGDAPSSEVQGDAATPRSEAERQPGMTLLSQGQLTHSSAGSSLQVSVPGGELGHVLVHANYSRNVLSAQVAGENAQLTAAIAAHLPGAEQRLMGEHGLRAALSVAGSGLGSATQDSASSQSGQEGSQTDRPTPQRFASAQPALGSHSSSRPAVRPDLSPRSTNEGTINIRI